MSHRRDYSYPEKQAIPSIACDEVQYGPKGNGSETCVSDWHKSDTASSDNVPADANENPGALAGATGAQNVHEAAQLPELDTTPADSRARAAKVFSYALTLDTFDGWNGASVVWSARLSKRDRAQLAWAALRSLDWHDAYATAKTVLGASTPPGPSLFNPMPEARFWAERSTPAELDAYCLAAFEEMNADRQAAFLAHVQGRKAA